MLKTKIPLPIKQQPHIINAVHILITNMSTEMEILQERNKMCTYIASLPNLVDAESGGIGFDDPAVGIGELVAWERSRIHCTPPDPTLEPDLSFSPLPLLIHG